ncbi:MAG TPA: HAD family hydrolase [Opitutaceae bacterium]|nr:HAD family hydrolase [Opitutaceae bacterium]
MTRFSTVLFDLDGTILDHFAAIHRTHSQTLQHFGLAAPTMAEVRSSVGGGLETAVEKLFGPANIALVEQAIPVYRSYWPANLLYEAKLLAGTKQLLAALKAAGIRRAVFTNKHGPSAREVLQHLGVGELLDGIFGAFDTPWLKPDARFAQHVMQALGADAATTCMVGDSPFDIKAAHNAGIPCYCVSTGTHSAEELRAEKADRVYPDLNTLGRDGLGVL